jgi:uncharacterized protein
VKAPFFAQVEVKSMQVPTIELSERKKRYELHLGSEVIGFSQYRDADGRRLFLHTEVEPDYQGHGLASQLIEYALNDTRAAGLRVVPLCPMVASYVTRHHEFDDILDPTGDL